MDAVLIIEDQLAMVHIIQKYLHSLNDKMTEDNVYCFSISDECTEIKSLSDCLASFKNTEDEEPRFFFKGHNEQVINQTIEFIKKHNKDHVFVMIDILLNSLDASMPTPTKYRQDAEYSDAIYMELLKGSYYKKYQTTYGIIPENLDYLLYSRSSASRSVMSVLLLEQYQKMKNAAEKIKGKEIQEEDTKTVIDVFNAMNFHFYYTENIKWCKNCCEGTVNSKPKPMDPPLFIPDSYMKLIKQVMFCNEVKKNGVR